MDGLYDQDLVPWSKEQARALRAAADSGWNASIGWENVAEEIEGLGRSERHVLASHIALVIEHLLRLQVSPATGPARGWRDTIRCARGQIERTLEESPSLRGEVAELTAREMPRARALVRPNLHDYGEHPIADIDTIAYTEAQVLGIGCPIKPRTATHRPPPAMDMRQASA